MNVVLSMLKFNLQWYARVMRNILLRYKMLALFSILLICPTLASLVNLLTFPLKSLFLYPVTNVTSFCCSLFFYQAFGVIWISIQYIAIFKQPWQKYLNTLQFSNIQKKLIDVSLLLFVDIIMWMPLLLMAIKSIFELSLSPYSILLITVKCIVFVGMTLLVQISLIKSKYYLWIAVLLTDMFIIFSVVLVNQLSQLMLMIFLIPVIYILISSCYENEDRKMIAEKKRSAIFISKVNYKKSVPILRIQIKNLIKHSSQLTILFSVMFVISLIAIVLMIYGEANPLLPFFLSIIMLMNSLSVSNIFNRIHTQWEEFSSYFTSLPLGKTSLFKNSLIIALSIVVLFNISIIFVASFLSNSHLVSKIIISFLLSIIFLAIAYVPQVKFRRFGFFVSFWLMVVFLYVDYLLI